MGLQQLWFITLAVLFIGFFVLEGFDFGVGMLMEFFGRSADATPPSLRSPPDRQPTSRSPPPARTSGRWPPSIAWSP